jgi:hypothetical protein
MRHYCNMTPLHYFLRCTLWNSETTCEAGQGRKKAGGAQSIERAILVLRAGEKSTECGRVGAARGIFHLT